MSAVWEWLNRYGSAIQAVAAVLILGATGWYAYLTYRLVGLQENTHRERRSQLRAVVLSVRRGLQELPLSRPSSTSKLTDAVIWDASDVAEMRTLAALEGSQLGDVAARVVSALRWLEGVQRESKDPEYNWDFFPEERWHSEMARANDYVTTIWRALTPEQSD